MDNRLLKKFDRAKLKPYDLDGPEFSASSNWFPISFDEDTRNGTYYFEMLPGAVTKPHIHEGFEEFLILEGEAIESDGTVLRPGDYVIYRPGSDHHTRSISGCLMLVFEWTP